MTNSILEENLLNIKDKEPRSYKILKECLNQFRTLKQILYEPKIGLNIFEGGNYKIQDVDKLTIINLIRRYTFQLISLNDTVTQNLENEQLTLEFRKRVYEIIIEKEKTYFEGLERIILGNMNYQ